MCPFVIVVIIIALVLFMPAVYSMGVARGITMERHPEQECATGGMPSTQPQTKCTKCAKARICQNPPPGMAVFC